MKKILFVLPLLLFGCSFQSFTPQESTAENLIVSINDGQLELNQSIDSLDVDAVAVANLVRVTEDYLCKENIISIELNNIDWLYSRSTHTHYFSVVDGFFKYRHSHTVTNSNGGIDSYQCDVYEMHYACNCGAKTTAFVHSFN